MPTPHGSRGGMAFSADELRVLRRALAEAARTAPTAELPAEPAHRAGAVHNYLRLAEALDEAAREGDRLRSFLRADLARYRAALPGTAADYLELLGEALDSGYLPRPEDLTALGELCGLPCGPAESYRREGMRRRCEDLAERAARARLDGRTPRPRPAEWGWARPADRKLLALPGGRRAGGPVEEPPQPPQSPDPERRVPTPAEIWPPRRRDTTPEQERRAIG
ncbi:hypothetical protein [Streptomyces sp. RPT161]|uniref:hypothetical protein n=1 Tax=Streptomyces sp. RPT161 TaxID=3015993 RepID=UPI0022B93434|nr:hypothetical protein [Streptomyces sp. RPT161]